MIKFPLFLKPYFLDKRKLIRLGSVDDGGYVVPISDIKNSQILLSMGISDNWDFEKNFSKISNAKIIAFDDSIDNKFWLNRFKKDLIKFLKFKIFKPKKIYKMFQYLDFVIFFKRNINNKFFIKRIGNKKDCINLNEIFKNEILENQKVFLKIDIEGSEYEILDQIIFFKNKIQGLVIEFHNVSSNFDKIKKFLKRIEKNLKLVHIHANNYTVKKKNQFPEAIELTISSSVNIIKKNKNSRKYPIKGLDFPNSKRSPDIKIIF